MENKNKGNKSKIKPGDINCIIDKMDRDGGNKVQRIYRCHSNYATIDPSAATTDPPTKNPG